MDEDIKILTNLQSSNKDILSSLKNVTETLNSDQSESVRIKQLENGAIKSIIGILRCSEKVNLLTEAARCLSMVTRGCDELRYALAKMGVVKVLLPLLTPPYHDSDKTLKDIEWEWVPVQEQVVSALRKVTFLCEENHASFVRLGGIGILLQLIEEEYSPSRQNYPPNTLNRLRSLAENKYFIAAVTPVPSDQRGSTSPSFPIFQTLGKTLNDNYPLYCIDIADAKKNWIARTLVKERLASFDEVLFPPSSKISWIIVRITHVSGPVAMWAEFSVDKKPQHILDMFKTFHSQAQPACSSSPPITLSPGSVYAVYTDGERKGWYRGWLLQPPSSGNYTFFCLDYGFSISVPLSNVRPLPPQFRGVAPQAAPCILTGLTRPPKSLYLLECCTGILRNIVSEKEAYRKEMMAKGLIPMYMRLLTKCYIDEVCINMILTLLNFCESLNICQLMRQLGAIQIFIDLCQKSTNPKVQSSLLGCINTMITVDKECFEVFERFNGFSKLERCSNEENCHKETRKYITLLLEKATRIKNGSLTEVKINQNGLLSSTDGLSDGFQKKASPISPHKTSSQMTSSHMMSSHVTSPVYRVLGQTSLTQEVCTNPYSDEEEKPIKISPTGVPAIQYGSHITFDYNKATECIDVDNVLEISTGHMLRSLCGIANTETGGDIYIGVLEDGRVKGVGLTRAERNYIRLDLDGLVTRLVPPVIPSRYSILFIPVVNGPRRKEQYVTRIEIKPLSVNRPIHVIHKKVDGSEIEDCYLHRSGRSIKISILEVREIIALEEQKKYENILQVLSQ